MGHPSASKPKARRIRSAEFRLLGLLQSHQRCAKAPVLPFTSAFRCHAPGFRNLTMLVSALSICLFQTTRLSSDGIPPPILRPNGPSTEQPGATPRVYDLPRCLSPEGAIQHAFEFGLQSCADQLRVFRRVGPMRHDPAFSIGASPRVRYSWTECCKQSSKVTAAVKAAPDMKCQHPF